MPLGTSNDLSRALNWGGAISVPKLKSTFISTYLSDIELRARREQVDVWRVVVSPLNGDIPPSEFFVNFISLVIC